MSCELVPPRFPSFNPADASACMQTNEGGIPPVSSSSGNCSTSVPRAKDHFQATRVLGIFQQVLSGRLRLQGREYAGRGLYRIEWDRVFGCTSIKVQIIALFSPTYPPRNWNLLVRSQAPCYFPLVRKKKYQEVGDFTHCPTCPYTLNS